MSQEKIGAGLLICRDARGIPAMLRYLRRARTAHVVAADDPRVHAAVQGHPGVDRVMFVEKVEAFYAVADEVLTILREINGWLARLRASRGIDPVLLFWVQHCEGGETTQRIQDALLLVRSYRELLTRERPVDITVVGEAGAPWEDDVLRACATAAGIEVRFIGPRGTWKRWWASWRPLAKEIYFSLRVGLVKLRTLGHAWNDQSGRPLVGVQICDAAKKHLNQALPLLKALNSRGLNGVAMCWASGDAAKTLRQSGVRAVELEAWLNVREVMESWSRACETWRIGREQLDEFLPVGPDSPAALIRPVLVRSMRAFMWGEIAQRQRLLLAARNFFTAHPPRAMRFWTRVLYQGVVAYQALPASCRPLCFWQPGWPYQVPAPYTRYDIPIDLVFALSPAHEEVLSREGFPSGHIVRAGQPWLARLAEFKRDYSQADSRGRLCLPAGKRLYVLCDAGYVIRGYYASAEQAMLIAALLALVRGHPEIHLIIKPHPAHKKGLLEALLGGCPAGMITVVPKDEIPYHALNAADVLVTKYSTLAIEGMVLGVPAIGVLLDREWRFACYDDAMDYVESVEKLEILLLRLAKDTGFRAEWNSRQAEKIAAYFQRHFTARGGDPNDVVAGAVQERLAFRSTTALKLRGATSALPGGGS